MMPVKYSRYVFSVCVWDPSLMAISQFKVITNVTERSTDAMRMVIEDWNEAQDGELREIRLENIASFERDPEAVEDD